MLRNLQLFQTMGCFQSASNGVECSQSAIIDAEMKRLNAINTRFAKMSCLLCSSDNNYRQTILKGSPYIAVDEAWTDELDCNNNYKIQMIEDDENSYINRCGHCIWWWLQSNLLMSMLDDMLGLDNRRRGR